MSSVIIGADNIYKDGCVQEQEQPVLLQIIISNDSDSSTIERNQEAFQVSSLGAKLDYCQVLQDLKTRANYSGKVVSKIYKVNENSSSSMQLVETFVKNAVAECLIYNPPKIEVEYYVPTSGPNSLNLLLLLYKLDSRIDFGEFGKSLEQEFGKAVRFDSSKIKCRGVINLPIRDVSSNQESNLAPSSRDAQVAAVLCQYSYYISRIHEDNVEKDKLDHSIVAKIRSKVDPIQRFLRQPAIKKRSIEAKETIQKLSIIPHRWKAINNFQIYNGGDMVEEIPLKNVNNEINSIYKDLLKWDAINLGTIDSSSGIDCWLGMRCHEGEPFEETLAYKILYGISKDSDSRFSFVGNKGLLNTWLMLCRNSGFSSVLYINEEDRIVMYCTVGSDFGKDLLFNGDWVTTNLFQFIIGASPQYQQSVTNALILERVISDIEKKDKRAIKFLFIGHSLGGGLASNNAIVTKERHAVTFNAAGLNWLRISCSLALHNMSELTNPLQGRNRVHLFEIIGDELDVAQMVAEEIVLALNLYSVRPQLRGYSTDGTRKEIAAQDGGSKHSLTHFMLPIEQLLKIRV